MKSAEIRERFCRYFEKNGHTRVASSSLIPADDPTLYFTNAGMVPFKRVFTGEETRPYRRAVTFQKCLRVSGKHNDLEVVGRTPRHHTFFEMLGNFSFGDYFKREAIRFGWEFLTQEMGLARDRLWATVFEKDDEAAGLWAKEAGLPKGRILRFGEESNFWSMGPTGPCGPCAEIHYDQGREAGCGKKSCGVNCESSRGGVSCGRYLEIWNLVFMQFNRDERGTLTPLPRPSIDTGMGLERLAAAVQGRTSNYETDLFLPLIHEIEAATGTNYGRREAADVSIRVLADHLRASSFLALEGIVPTNEGRGYVLRRILRRAIRHGKLLGMTEPFVHKLVPALADLMFVAYPELAAEVERIGQVILSEEEKFLETLEAGTKLLEAEIASLKRQRHKGVPGATAFKLYDTYGFPLDLTELMAAEQKLGLDRAGFDAAMADQKKRARAAWKGSGAKGGGQVYADVYARGLRTEFTGYAALKGESEVAALFKEGRSCDEAREGEGVELITPTTPFYGESGGQVGDRGRIVSNDVELEVRDTVKPYPDLHIHKATVLKGAVRVGQIAELWVDPDFRTPVMLNHSATHLIHAALRTRLGNHVRQAGSLVDTTRLRFDFSHFRQVGEDELQALEDLVNEKIRSNLEITHKVMPYSEAMALGALAFFGDKYGDRVRVCRMGDFSIELCGGTHVRRTGEIGLFKILSESSVASGVRRVEAVTGTGGLAHLRALEKTVGEVASTLKAAPKDVVAKVMRLLEEVKGLERQVEATRRAVQTTSGVEEEHTVGGYKVILYSSPDADAKALRDQSDRLIHKVASGIVVLAGAAQGKAHLVVRVSPDLTARVKADVVAKALAERVGGSGGGRADMAQAGGPRGVTGAELVETLRGLLS